MLESSEAKILTAWLDLHNIDKPDAFGLYHDRIHKDSGRSRPAKTPPRPEPEDEPDYVFGLPVDDGNDYERYLDWMDEPL